MSPNIIELLGLSLFFYTLGLMTLVLIGLRKGLIAWIGVHSLAAGVIILWLSELKWILMGGISFMFIASAYTIWSLNRDFNQCVHEIKESKNTEQGGSNDADDQ